MGSISGETHRISKTMEKAQDMATEWPQPSLMKQVQNFKITILMISTIRNDWEGWPAALLKGCILAQAPLNAGAVRYSLPYSLAGQGRCKIWRVSNLVVAPILTHAYLSKERKQILS